MFSLLRQTAGCVAGLTLFAVAAQAAALNAASPNAGLLSFIEPNRGQTAIEYSHVARVPDYTALLRPEEAVFLLSAPAPRPALVDAPPSLRTAAVQMRLLGANAQATAEAGPALTGKSNYLRGADPAAWVTGVPHYSTVRFGDVYPGIDVVYSLHGGSLRYDFVVATHGNANDIRLSFADADTVALDDDGALRIRSKLGELVHSAPHIYQQRDGERQVVDGQFAVDADGTLRFQVAQRDATSALVIDPSVSFSTYLGGSNSDGAQDLAVDPLGRVVVVGTTTSLDFPFNLPPLAAGGGSADVFIARFAADGQSLSFATYLGGSAADNPHQVELDPSGNIIVAGYTSSSDFPIFNAAQPTFQGGGGFDSDGFIFKLSPSGDALVYSTFLGGSGPVPPLFGFEWIRGLVIDDSGKAYVVGETSSIDFPATHSLNGRPCVDGETGLPTEFIGDAFVARFALDGTLDFAVCVGGAQRDNGRGIALGDDGAIHIVGFTRSEDYPTTTGAYQEALAGSYDVHVTRLNAAATDIEWATLMGGAGYEYAQQLRIAADGSIVVVGATDSADFPTTPGVVQPAISPNATNTLLEAFVFRLSADAGNLIFGTFLGGTGDDSGWGLDLDAQGRIHVSGSTSSWDFPLVDPTQPIKGAPATFGDELGAASDDTRALATGDMIVNGELRSVVAAGNNGVNRLFVLDDSGGPATAYNIGTATDTTRAIALFDSDLDFVADGVVVGNSATRSQAYLSDGSGGFLAPANLNGNGLDTRAVVVAPLVFGVEDDLVIGNYLAANTYHVGSATGFGPGFAGFPSSETTATTALVVADLNGDFINDVVEANDNQVNYLYLGNGSGFEAPQAIGPESDPSTSIAVGDMDGNGTPDIVVGNNGAPTRLYRNFGNGVFLPAESLDPAPVATTGIVLTYARSGIGRDIVADGVDAGWIYINDGTGQFERRVLLPAVEPSNALVAPDIFSNPYSAGAAGTPTRRIDVGLDDAYVAVLDITGTKLLFSTYLGGAGFDGSEWGLEVDDSGQIYMTGGTLAADFPTTSALQPASAGRDDAFLTKLDPEFGSSSPSASYSTFLIFDPPSIDGIRTVGFNWSVGACGSNALTDYAMSLYSDSAWIYTDTILVAGVLQPMGNEMRDPPFWDFDFSTLMLNQFNTGADAVISSPGAIGINYLASDNDSLPADGQVLLSKWDNGAFVDGGIGNVNIQITYLVASDCDGDGVEASIDNCSLVANASQADSDGDGIGNRCDADLNNDCAVNPLDLGIMKNVFFTTDADADLNADGQVNTVDLGIMKQLFFAPPGPSGLANACSGP